MKITTEQLLDEALAIRAEATIVDRCPCCESRTGAIPALEPGAHSDMTWGHEYWCPAADDSIAWLFRRTGAEMRHIPLFAVEQHGRPVVVVLMGRKGKRPLDAEQIGRLLSSETPTRTVQASLARPVETSVSWEPGVRAGSAERKSADQRACLQRSGATGQEQQHVHQSH